MIEEGKVCATENSMIAFKKMWSDVSHLISNEEFAEMDIVENFRSGFIVRDKEDTLFITRDDFVDFWCRMLCYHEISKDQILKNENIKDKYVYTVVKKLPYIAETSAGIKLVE